MRILNPAVKEPHSFTLLSTFWIGSFGSQLLGAAVNLFKVFRMVSLSVGYGGSHKKIFVGAVLIEVRFECSQKRRAEAIHF